MGFISGGLFGFFAGGVLMFVLYPTEWIQHPSRQAFLLLFQDSVIGQP